MKPAKTKTGRGKRKNAPEMASRSVKELLSARRDLIDCPSSLVL